MRDEMRQREELHVSTHPSAQAKETAKAKAGLGLCNSQCYQKEIGPWQTWTKAKNSLFLKVFFSKGRPLADQNQVLRHMVMH